MLENLIPEMKFAKFQTAVTFLLATELLNQKDLFLTGGGSQNDYLSDVEFKVSDGRFYSNDISKYPLVNCWVGAGVPIEDDIATLSLDSKFHFDLYTYRQDEEKDGVIIDGTIGADKRLNYLISQVWYIMEAQKNLWKGVPKTFSSFKFESFTKKLDDSKPAGIPVSMARFTFSLGTDEDKEINEGREIEAYYAQLIANKKELTQLIVNL